MAGTRYSTAGTVKQFFFSFLFLFSLFSKCDEGYQIQYNLERFSRDRAFLMSRPKRRTPRAVSSSATSWYGLLGPPIVRHRISAIMSGEMHVTGPPVFQRFHGAHESQ